MRRRRESQISNNLTRQKKRLCTCITRFCTNTPPTMIYIRQRLLDIEQGTWISEIHNDERKDRRTHDYENYLANVRNINHRVPIRKLRLRNHKLAIETGRYVKPYKPPDQKICPLCKTGIEDEEHFLMNCIAYRDPRRELFNTLKKETNLFLDSMTPSSAFATLISMKQGEKTQKIVAKYYVCALIAFAKKKDALNITLSNCINSTNVHLCNYCTKIFVIVVNTCL